MSRPKIGDIVEIKTQRGFAYALYTHQHERYGSLLRVFGQIYAERPISFEPLLAEPPQFDTFYPLLGAVKKGNVSVAAHVGIPEHLWRFPVFRAEGGISSDGTVQNWWLWDGKNEWRVGDLSAEEKKYPVRGTVNHSLLMEWIESGHTPAETS